MRDENAIAKLQAENGELRIRLEECEATLDAIRKGEVDAVVVAGADGHRVYTLEGADQFYRVLIEAMQPGQGAASLGADGTVLYCNRSLATLLGMPQQKVAGGLFGDFVAASERTEWKDFLGHALEREGQREFLLQPAAGSPVPVHLALNLLPLSGAVALGLVVTDLTDRKSWEDAARRLVHEETARSDAEEIARLAILSESSARRSEARFRHLADALPQMVWMARPDGQLDYFNERWYDYAGTRSEREGDASWVPVLHPDDHKRCLDLWHGCVRTGDVYRIEYRLRDHRTGKYRWFLARAVPVRDEDGGIMRWFGTCTDIDETKKAAERQRLLWEAASVLLTCEEPDAMMRMLYAGIAPRLGLDAYFNFMVDETGSSLRMESCIGISDEEARSVARIPFGQAVCGNVAITRRPITVDSIQSSDDPKVQGLKAFGMRTCACNPLIAGGRLLGTLSFASRTRDSFEEEEHEFLRTVTYYVTVAYERIRLLHQLQETDRRKDEFLAILGHELRNPLAPIRNAAQILKLKGETDPAVRHAREIIERQGSHLTRLVDDLLDVSRITRGKISLRKERLDLRSVLTSAIETSRPVIEKAGHELQVDLPTEDLVLPGDLTRLAQVFGNLLVNAAKYTDRGGVIRLSACREGSDAVISVSDTGIGIPAVHLPRLFEIFSQVDSAIERTQGGLGIGLSLVKGLVGMHGGSVSARSEGPGRGSEFIVRLPLATATGSTVTLPGAPVNGAGRPFRILVADDNVDSAQSLATMLSLVGHEVRTAYDGLAAVELASEFRPDIVLLDIGMPRLNGYEAAERIRGCPWGKSTFLVAVTGWGQFEDKRRAEASGFDRHFTKPVTLEALDRVFESVSVT